MHQIPGHPTETKKINQPLLEMHERRSQDGRCTVVRKMCVPCREKDKHHRSLAKRISAMK